MDERTIVEPETTRDRPENKAGRDASRQVHTWNRRLHYYLGLYFLLFIWLFSISGLLLNHPEWEFASFRAERLETASERVIAEPDAEGDLAIAKALMRQLGLVGEINRTSRNAAGDLFTFQVSRPGEVVDVEADFGTRRAFVNEIRLNAWGVLDALHRFNGVSMRDPSRERDWWLTKVWTAAMDALAIGLIILVLSGLYLWYRLKPKRRAGLAALAAGTTLCGFFLVGLALIF